MEAGIKEQRRTDTKSPQAVLTEFFSVHTPEGVREMFWYVFKAWVNSPEEHRVRYGDEEIALFLDQLTDLVAAASQLHQSGQGTQSGQGGEGHE